MIRGHKVADVYDKAANLHPETTKENRIGGSRMRMAKQLGVSQRLLKDMIPRLNTKCNFHMSLQAIVTLADQHPGVYCPLFVSLSPMLSYVGL